jgi:hypothetical protein
VKVGASIYDIPWNMSEATSYIPLKTYSGTLLNAPIDMTALDAPDKAALTPVLIIPESKPVARALVSLS